MENNADKLRELLNIGTKTKQTDTSILKSRHNVNFIIKIKYKIKMKQLCLKLKA